MNKQYILPAHCKRCDATFDLYYELLESKDTRDEIEEKLGKELSQSLCWGCKKQILTPPSQEEESSDLDDFFLDLNIEFE